jgi:hypothetical protein
MDRLFDHRWQATRSLLVAAVAAYSSYDINAGSRRSAAPAHTPRARLWPLLVDCLVLLASIGLLRLGPHTTRRNRCTQRLVFALRIAVSLPPRSPPHLPKAGAVSLASTSQAFKSSVMAAGVGQALVEWTRSWLVWSALSLFGDRRYREDAGEREQDAAEVEP